MLRSADSPYLSSQRLRAQRANSEADPKGEREARVKLGSTLLFVTEIQMDPGFRRDDGWKSSICPGDSA
jgi:hypothetical protein